MPSKLRQQYLVASSDTEKATNFIQTIRQHLPEFLKEQVDKGGTTEQVMGASVADAIVLGYVAGRQDERMFMRNLLLEEARKHQLAQRKKPEIVTD